jgi:hypothetical protein
LIGFTRFLNGVTLNEAFENKHCGLNFKSPLLPADNFKTLSLINGYYNS